MGKNNSFKEEMSDLGLGNHRYTVVHDAMLGYYQNRKNKCNIAVVFGKIFSYTTSGRDKKFNGSKGTLADEIYMDWSTVNTIAKILIADGFITDITPSEFKSKTQVRHYVANVDALSKLEKVERRHNKMSDDARKSMNEKKLAAKLRYQQEQVDQTPPLDEEVPYWVDEPQVPEPIVEETPASLPTDVNVHGEGYVRPSRFEELRERHRLLDEETPLERIIRLLNEGYDGWIDPKDGKKLVKLPSDVQQRLNIHNATFGLDVAIQKGDEEKIAFWQAQVDSYATQTASVSQQVM